MIRSTIMLENPFTIDGTGKVAVTSDRGRQMALRVRSVLATRPGERVMRPTYGAGVTNYIFDVDDPMQASILMTAVEQALQVWEPEIVVDSVTVDPGDMADGIIALQVSYSLRSTGELETAVISISSTATYGWPS